MPRKKTAVNAPPTFKWVLAAIGAAFILFGLVFVVTLGQISTLECHRTDGMHCRLVTRWMNLIESSTIELGAIDSAWVGRVCDSEGCTFRVMLAAAQGEVPLTDTSSSETDPQYALVKQIGAYIADPQQSSLSLQAGDMLWVILPLVFILLGGGLMALGLRGIEAIFRAASR